MLDRNTIRGGFVSAALFCAVLIGSLGLLHACKSSNADRVHPAGDSFFPLAVGNRWRFNVTLRDSAIVPGPPDSVWIDQAKVLGGTRFYRLRAAWPGFSTGRWVRRDSTGNLFWTRSLGGREYPFLVVTADVGDTWFTGAGLCMDSLRMLDDYAVVETPFGRFDGVRKIGPVPLCIDFGWSLDVARGVGPVRWSAVTIAGVTGWTLVDAHVRDDALLPSHTPDYHRIVNGD